MLAATVMAIHRHCLVYVDGVGKASLLEIATELTRHTHTLRRRYVTWLCSWPIGLEGRSNVENREKNFHLTEAVELLSGHLGALVSANSMASHQTMTGDGQVEAVWEKSREKKAWVDGRFECVLSGESHH